MKRRDFLKRAGIIGGGATALNLSGLPIKAFAKPFLNIKNFDGKILVVLQLKGGNDGLNTIVPFEDDLYYSNRPTLAINKNEVIKITSQLGFNPNMQALQPLFDEGKMGIIQNVGYDNQDRSHFRSTDVWLSASDVDKYYYDGWLGRTLENANPNYPGTIPNHPMAVELGSTQSLLLESNHGGMGISFDDPWSFNELTQGSMIDNEPVPDTLAGNELKFLKQVSSQSIKYASIIKEHADAGWHDVEYPDTWIGWQLRVIANLIAGNMKTPVYVASHWGFDTHAKQADDHPQLLKEFADSVLAFQRDIEQQGLADKIVLMTVSEFGRRVAQNGGLGTDHGAAAPLFVFGNSVQGGFYGDQADLSKLDTFGDLPHEYDFREVYSTVMRDHLGIGKSARKTILKRDFGTLSFLGGPVGVKNNIPFTFNLSQNYPNPFNPTTRIKFSLASANKVSIIVYDMLGRKVRELVNGNYKAGDYTIDFNASKGGAKLASGVYIYRIKAGRFTSSRKMTLLK
ncbi:MAG: DUF1501 domain-containing protein [Melioribacteraceae bacterium]